MLQGDLGRNPKAPVGAAEPALLLGWCCYPLAMPLRSEVVRAFGCPRPKGQGLDESFTQALTLRRFGLVLGQFGPMTSLRPKRSWDCVILGCRLVRSASRVR